VKRGKLAARDNANMAASYDCSGMNYSGSPCDLARGLQKIGKRGIS
jgi:hypothetical protein